MADSAKFAEYTYLGAGTIVKVGHPAVPDGLDLVYGSGGTYPGLDRFGRVVDQRWQDSGGTPTVKDRYTYRYDGNSNRLYRKNELRPQLSELYRPDSEVVQGTEPFSGYDGLNRLTSFHRGVLNAGGDGIASGLGRSEAFGLDGLGNWRTYGVDATGNGTNDLDQTRKHNAVNEIADATDAIGEGGGQAAWVDPVYDAAGNMTQGPQPHNPTRSGTGETNRLHYKYDAWNRMTGVWRDNVGTPGTPGMLVYTYNYDGLHRRTRRLTILTAAMYYYNESWQVVEERDAGGAPKVQYVWDVRYIDAAVLRDRDWNFDGVCTEPATGAGLYNNEGDERVYYCQDANFNVTALVDAYDGVVVERYMYDPYGKPTALNGVRDAYGYSTALSEWGPRALNTFENELLYCGYRYDGGRAGHYHVRYRVYHPTLGRWTARDPIGYEEGMVLYQYAHSVPVLFSDPFGLAVTSHGKPDPETGSNCHGHSLSIATGNAEYKFDMGLPGVKGAVKTKKQEDAVWNSEAVQKLLKAKGVSRSDLESISDGGVTKHRFLYYALLSEIIQRLRESGCEMKGLELKDGKQKPCTSAPKPCDYAILLTFHKLAVDGEEIDVLVPVHSVVRTNAGVWESRDAAGGDIFTTDKIDEGIGEKDKTKTGTYPWDVIWCFACPKKCECSTDSTKK